MKRVLLVFLIVAAAWSAGEGLPFKGYYRYGEWTAFEASADDGPGAALESNGLYRVSGGDGLLFKPGLLPHDSLLSTVAGKVKGVVKGLQRLQGNDRLTLWYGYQMDPDAVFMKAAGPYRYIILHEALPNRACVLRNVDLIIIEKTTAALQTASAQTVLVNWLLGGGTIVIVSRDVLLAGDESMFAPFMTAGPGREVTETIRSKWRQGGTFALDEFYAIPAGFGRIILFPADKKDMGIDAAFQTRESAWEQLGRLAAPAPYPGRPQREQVARELDTLMPIRQADFTTQGSGMVLIIYLIALAVLIMAARGLKRILFLAGAVGAAVTVIILFYGHADSVSSSRTIYLGRSGQDYIQGRVFLKAAVFKAGTFEFSAEGREPFFPLLPRENGCELRQGEQFGHSLELAPFAGRIMAGRRTGRLPASLTWHKRPDGKLDLERPGWAREEETHFFDEGRVYRLPPAERAGRETIDLQTIGAMPEVGGPLLALLRAVRLMNGPQPQFILVSRSEEQNLTAVKGQHHKLEGRSHYLIGPAP